jgi:multiple antibiotic resistance protein
VIMQSVVTALLVAIGFVFIGQAVFRFLGITMGDFMIAGGIVLFCIAIIDIVIPGKKRRVPSQELGAVPLGTPLIVGPAVLTTSLILIGQYGVMGTLLSIAVNVCLAGIIFSLSRVLIKIIGVSGAKVLSKITSLLLAAIAVMLVRKGVFFLLRL